MRRNKYDTLFYIVIFVLVLVTLLLGTPIMGALVADNLYNLLGCSPPGFGDMSPCKILGMDISWRFAFYYIPIMGLIGAPLAFAYGFFDFVLFCMALMLLFKILSRRQNK